MTTQTIKHLILAAVIAAGLVGCDNMIQKEHAKTVEKSKGDWDRTRLGFVVEVAEQDYKVGDYDKCREQLKDAIMADAAVPSVYILSAKVELEGGSLELAASYLKKALALNQADNTPDPEPYYLMGVVYQRWQQMDTAATYYELAMAKKPSEAIYVLADVEMKMATGKLDEAKNLLESKIGFFEQSAAMRIALARIATLQHDPETAAKDYRDATLLSPEDNHLQWSYAQALYDAGKYADAAKILEDLRADPMELPKPANSLVKGESANDKKADEQGAKDNRVTVLMMLGECYVALNRPANARDCIQEVIRLQPENTDAYISLAKACLLTNDLNLTRAAALHVLRNDPQNVSAMILEAAVQQKEKKWTDSLDTLADAARLAPKDVTVLCMQGLSELQLGKKDIATGYFEKAVAANPSDAWANDLLAQVKPPEAKPSSLLPTYGTDSPTADSAPIGLQSDRPATPAANRTMTSDDPTHVTNAAPKD